jgi:hypothetical protein
VSAASASWEPANDVERDLRDAWLRNDNLMFLRTLATAPLYLPGFSGRTVEQRLLTWSHARRTHLLVFTSPEAMYQQLTDVVDGWRMTSVAELARALPDPEWGVAISPNTPIGACLDPEELATLADAVTAESLFRPATATEAVMFRARQDRDPAAYLDALVVSSLLVPVAGPAGAADIGRPDFPWLLDPGGGATVVAFTSDLRLAEVVSDRTPTVRVETMALARSWPDRSVNLAVNPGSPIASAFTGDQVADLIEWGRTLPLRTGDGPHAPLPRPAAEPAGTARPDPEPALVEVDISPADVDAYLNGAYDRILDLPRLTAPATQARHVIRWRRTGVEGTATSSIVDGAQIVRVGPGGDRLIATYHVDLRRWLPAVTDLLRGNAPG